MKNISEITFGKTEVKRADQRRQGGKKEKQRRQTGTIDLLNAEIGHEMEPTEMVITEEMAERQG